MHASRYLDNTWSSIYWCILTSYIEHDQSEADEKFGLTLCEESAIESLSRAIGASLGEEFQPIVDALNVTST